MTRRAMVLLTLVALCTSLVVAPAPARVAPAGRPPMLPMAQLASVLGSSFDLPAPPVGQTPEQRAYWILEERPALGRTPMEWVRWSQATFNLEAGSSDPLGGDIVSGVLRLYALVGVPVGPTGALDIARAAAAVPEPVRGPFGGLVQVVADAYAAQLPISRAVAARLEATLDYHAVTALVTAAERDLMAARQAKIVRALNAFRALTSSYFEAADGSDDPIFSDPEGLVILGGLENGTYTRGGLIPDPVLLVDPAGSDTYLNSAGGACPVTPDNGFGGRWLECNLLALSVVADLGDDFARQSDDIYFYDGPPAAVQGAGGPGGLGILVDVAGDDQYLAKMTRGAWGAFFQYFDGGAQGYGFAGNGLQLDGLGNDTYRFDVYSSHGNDIWAFGQGFGGAGSLGISSDLSGNDLWLSNGLGLIGAGFEGLYTDGVGFYGGVGIMADAGQGADVYSAILTAQTVDFYAQGFGGLGGLGILYEDGGNDDYFTLQQASDPWINPLLNCAFGTASFGGVGVMVELGGDDVYYGASISPYGATVMDSGFGGPGVAYGLFVDTGGDDHYEMYAQGSSTMIQGRGLWEPGIGGDPFSEPLGHNTFGTFVDIGGQDTYIGGYGVNDGVWPFGVDRSA